MRPKVSCHSVPLRRSLVSHCPRDRSRLLASRAGGIARPRTNAPVARLIRLCVTMVWCSVAVVGPASALMVTADAPPEAAAGVPFDLAVQVAASAPEIDLQVPDVADALVAAGWSGVRVEPRGVVRRRSGVTLMNGRRTERTTLIYAWRLTAEDPGTFKVPPLRFATPDAVAFTEPLSVEVLDPVAPELLSASIRVLDAAGGRDPPARVYVGQRVRLVLELRLRAFNAPQLGVELDAQTMFRCLDLEATRWGLFEQALPAASGRRGGTPRGLRIRRDVGTDGQAVYVYELEASVYADRTGPLLSGGDNDAVRVVSVYPLEVRPLRSMVGRQSLAVTRSRVVTASPEPPGVIAVPVPRRDRPPGYRGAVGRFEVRAAVDRPDAQAGTPLRLRVVVDGDGSLERLPAPPLHELEDFRTRFELDDRPPGGLVLDGVKVFEYTLTPRSTEVTEVPPVPLVSFDPAVEAFVTAASQPIPIDVRPAEVLSLDGYAASLPDASEQASADAPFAPQASPRSSVREALPGWTQVAEGAMHRLATGPWQRAVLWGPPLMLASWLLVVVLRQHPGARRRWALVRCKRRLRGASDAASIRRGLLDLLSVACPDAMCGRDPEALTAEDLAESVRDQPHLSAALELVRGCDAHRFSGGPSPPVDALRQEAQKLLRTWPNQRAGTRAFKGAAGVVAAGLLTFAPPLVTSAAGVGDGNGDGIDGHADAASVVRVVADRDRPVAGHHAMRWEALKDVRSSPFLAGPRLQAGGVVASDLLDRRGLRPVLTGAFWFGWPTLWLGIWIWLRRRLRQGGRHRLPRERAPSAAAYALIGAGTLTVGVGVAGMAASLATRPPPGMGLLPAGSFLRAGPGDDFPSVGPPEQPLEVAEPVATPGDEAWIRVLNRRGRWLHVRLTATGETGWVSTDEVDLPPEAEGSAQRPPTAAGAS